VKAVIRELVIGQRAAELNILRKVASGIRFKCAQQHGGQTDGVGFRLKLLPVWNQHGRCLEAAAIVGYVVHRVSKESAGTAGRVVQGADQAGIPLEQFIIRVQQKRGSQVNNITRGHEIFGALVDFSPKAADQMFVDIAHHPVRHCMRV